MLQDQVRPIKPGRIERAGELVKMSKSEATTYGRYLIKAIKSGPDWQARAFQGMQIASGVEFADTRDAAIAAVKGTLDAARAEEQEVRRRTGYPSVAAVAAALRAIRITPGQEKMLDSHLAAPDRIFTATQLADAAGYENYQAANMQYGLLGRKLAEELEWEPAERDGDAPVWTFALATDADDEARVASSGGRWTAEWRWRLRPELVEARSLVRMTGRDARIAAGL